MEAFMTANFWLAVGQIIMIDILLGGDNAVVIALACRQLPAHLRLKGILWGTAGATGRRRARPYPEQRQAVGSSQDGDCGRSGYEH